MLLGDAARPAAGKLVFEGFRFSESTERVFESGFHQIQNAERRSAVLFHPVR
jgi:hypothetical protein